MRAQFLGVIVVTAAILVGRVCAEEAGPKPRAAPAPDPTAALVKSLPLDPVELAKPPDVTIFIKNINLLACLEKEGLKPLKEVPILKDVDLRVAPGVGVFVHGRYTGERDWAFGGDAARSPWRLTVFEATSMEDATAVMLNMAAWIANTPPKVGPLWEGKPIGEVSLGHFPSPEVSWTTTVFRRGNLAIAVMGRQLGGEPPKVDAARVAAMIDRYLTERPEPRAVEATKRLDIALKGLPSAADKGAADWLIAQKPYALSVDKMPDEAKGGELRFYVERGAITEKDGGALHVTFTAPGKHRLWCYVSDSKGTWVAAGEKELVVEAALGEPEKEGSGQKGTGGWLLWTGLVLGLTLVLVVWVVVRRVRRPAAQKPNGTAC